MYEYRYAVATSLHRTDAAADCFVAAGMNTRLHHTASGRVFLTTRSTYLCHRLQLGTGTGRTRRSFQHQTRLRAASRTWGSIQEAIREIRVGPLSVSLFRCAQSPSNCVGTGVSKYIRDGLQKPAHTQSDVAMHTCGYARRSFGSMCARGRVPDAASAGNVTPGRCALY